MIKGLVEAGKEVCLALEMFNEDQAEALDQFRLGKLTEQEFQDQADYFNVWGHNYRYYKPIFDYVAEKHIKMYGVNIAKDYASKIGRGGLESLTDEERAALRRYLSESRGPADPLDPDDA